MRTILSPLALAAVLGLVAGTGLTRAADSTDLQRENQAVAQATSWLNQRVANFVQAAHPLSYHHATELQSAARRPDGGYRIVFDVAYKGRILGNVYWAELAVNISPNGTIEGYLWGSDSNFYPPYLARKTADKLLR